MNVKQRSFSDRNKAHMKKNEAVKSFLLFLLNPYFIHKKKLRDALSKAVRNQTGELILDVGCGLQPYRGLFSGYRRYVGIDSEISRKPDICASAESIPFETATVDAVLCTELLEHLCEPKTVLQEIARVLKPGGLLFLTAPMSWNLHYEPHDYYRYTKYGLAYLADQAGFIVESTTRVGGLFSFIGSRLIDALHSKLRRLPLVNRLRFCGFIASIFLLPLTLFFYILAWPLDKIDDTDAIGWLIVARRKTKGHDGRNA